MKKLLLYALAPLALVACEDEWPQQVPDNGADAADNTPDCTNAPKTDKRCYYDDGTAK